MNATRIARDHLRPPLPLDPSAAAYKDWLHVNVFEHSSGLVGIINVSLDGAPDTPAARATSTALVELPGRGWVGNMAIRAFGDAQIGIDSIALDAAAIRLDSTRGLISASARLPRDDLEIDLNAEARTPAIVPDHTATFGSGWIGWYAVPRLAPDGEIRVDGRVFPLAGSSAYVDHTWGRWHWGEDAGWEWGSFLSQSPGPSLVLSRVCDRLHLRTREMSFEVRLERGRRWFGEGALTVTWSGVLEVLPHRLPGSLAALHVDRARPRLPSALTIVADDGHDHVVLEFTARAAAQLILADTAQRGYSFLHELVGSFHCSGSVSGESFQAEGLAVVERVE